MINKLKLWYTTNKQTINLILADCVRVALLIFFGYCIWLYIKQ
jgi:hypothetical protein